MRRHIPEVLLLADRLSADAAEHDLALAFRADASGALHIYETRRFAMQEGALRVDCLAGRFLASLARLCGPGLHRLPEIERALQGARNSARRAYLRRLNRNSNGALAAAEREAMERAREIAEVFAEYRREYPQVSNRHFRGKSVRLIP